MADAKITGLAALAADPADTDMFVIVDVSDTSMAATGTNKKLAASYLMKASRDASYPLLTGTRPFTGAQTFNAGLTVGANAVSGVRIIGIDSGGINFFEVRGDGSLYTLGLGRNALSSNTTGTENQAMGLNALLNNTTGSGGVAVGVFALSANTVGNYNVGVGLAALASNVSGDQNVGLGRNALFANTTGYYNVGIGGGALSANTTGFENMALGLNALLNNTTGSDNVSIGPFANSGNTTGSNNIVIGPNLNAPSATASHQLVIGSYIAGDGSAIAIKPRANSTAAILFQDAAASTIAAIDTTDSATAAVVDRISLIGTSSGTPGAGFGSAIRAGLKSSTTANQDAGRLTFAWSTATHASRAAVGKLTAYYTSTEREAITWTADSASVTVSIAGNTRATGSVQVTGSAFASHTGGKSFNAQGAGFDGTRYWAGYVALGAYWDATNWKTGTDGGSNGASLIISQGLGDDLSFYTMTSTGTSQQTIAHGSLASSLRLTLNASYAAFTGAVRSGYDTNLTSYFGRAAIGYNGSTSDVASFGHIDMNSAANIALFQTAAGESWFNCASGQNLIFARGGFSLGQWDTSGNLHPAVDNTVDCGKSGSRWNDIWASNATIQTSDERDKVAVKTSALGLDFVKALQPVSWVWADIDRPAVTEKRQNEDGTEYDHVLVQAVKKTHKRPHFGFVAQQVKQALDAVGVDDFAGYIYDEATDSYSLRYSEFLSPIVKALQELLQRVERLEKAN